MRKTFNFVGLKKEANLLDSKLFLLKAFLAVSTAYIWASNNSMLKFDTISVLFGTMCTLEPVNMTGIRSGFEQICATSVGAACSALVLFVGGFNTVTVALCVVATLYASLKINWRAISPLAFFTAIYMTQYVQKDMYNQPSIWITLRLRLCALAAGVLVAIAFNFIFSLISYKSMMKKRMTFIVDKVQDDLKDTLEAIQQESKDSMENLKGRISNNSNDIAWIASYFADIEKETNGKLKLVGVSRELIDHFESKAILLQTINHLNYDLCFILAKQNSSLSNLGENKEMTVSGINCVLENLNEFKNNDKEMHSKLIPQICSQAGMDGNFERMRHDLEMMIYTSKEMNE